MVNHGDITFLAEQVISSPSVVEGLSRIQLLYYVAFSAVGLSASNMVSFCYALAQIDTVSYDGFIELLLSVRIA